MEETTLDPSLHLSSPNHELSFELHFWFEVIEFPTKWCHVNTISIWFHLLLDLKALGFIYGFQPIGMLHFVGPWTLV
jgi:hypothetical protein